MAILEITLDRKSLEEVSREVKPGKEPNLELFANTVIVPEFKEFLKTPDAKQILQGSGG